MKSIFISFLLLNFATSSIGQRQNNILCGKVLYLSSGNKPAVGVRISEPDATAVYSLNNGSYLLKFQNKRNGATLELEIGKDGIINDREGKKLELVNEREIKAAKLPARAEDSLEIIVSPVGQRDIAAQKYYKILRTTADRELEGKIKEVDALMEQKEKDYQRIRDLIGVIDQMQAALDSAKIYEQALNIASINLDRTSQMTKAAVERLEEYNDAEGALKILNIQALDTAYEHASKLRKKADAAIRQVIEGYELKISLLNPQFKYGEVAECYEKIARIYDKEDYEKEQLATIFAHAAIYWELDGNYQKQLEANLKDLMIREKIQSIDHPDLAQTYGRLASSYLNLGNYQKAVDLTQKALVIQEKVLPPYNHNLAITYSILATAYGYWGEYQKQLEFNLKAFDIMEKVLSDNHPDLATLYNNLALTYFNLGEYPKGLEFNLKALAIQEQILSANHPDLAQSYGKVASAYINLGEYQKAGEFSQKAVAIQEKTLSSYHPHLATTYSIIALIYHYLGEYQKQLEFNLKALIIKENIFPSDHPDLATLYSNLVVNCNHLRDYSKSLEFGQKALAIYGTAPSVNQPYLAKLHGNLAATYFGLGDYHKALELFQGVLTIQEKMLPADHLDLVTTYNNIAVTCSSLGKYQKALEFNLKSLAIYEKKLPGDHPLIAISNSNTGRAYRDIGNLTKSIEHIRKAISIGESSNPKHHYLYRFYGNIGITYIKLRKFPEAQVALEKSEKLNAEERVFRGWAMYYALQKKKIEAIESLQKAVEMGFKDLNWLETEPDLKSIRKEKGYKVLVEQLDK